MPTGYEGEKMVEKRLKEEGSKVEIRRNTKLPGQTDIIAKWPGGKKWRIQVKSTNTPGPPDGPSTSELAILKMTASLNNETPVIAYVHSNNKIEFKSARTEKKLKA